MLSPQPNGAPQNAPNEPNQETASAVSLDQAQPVAATLEPSQALEMLIQDPVGFVEQIVESAAQKHLTVLKETAELRAAVNVMRNQYPEFSRFEPFVLQEVAGLLQSDPQTAMESWDRLLQKGLKAFQGKLKDTVNAQMGEQAVQADNQPNSKSMVPHVEATANRMPKADPASFTRAQIANMSLAEFLKNEAAINEALKNKRIQ